MKNQMNTTEVADQLGLDRNILLEYLQEENLVQYNPSSRHYSANPALVRGGLATGGKLRWTPKGVEFIKNAYS